MNTTTGASAPTNHQLEIVEFHGDTIYVVEHNNEAYVPVRGIIENLGLSWKPQYSRLDKNRQRLTVTKMVTVTQDGKSRQTICIPARKLPIFLAGINPNKVRNELRAKIISYQNECDDVLHDYWTKGHATNPRHPEAEKKEPQLADLAEQSQQTSLALNSPSLSDSQRWELATKITVALFGADAAYLLGEKEVAAYNKNHPTKVMLPTKCFQLGNYPSLTPVLELSPTGIQLSSATYNSFVKQACTVQVGIAGSEGSLYEAFCHWFVAKLDYRAPPLELFKAQISQHHRCITLAGRPWYLGITPQNQNEEVLS